MLNERTKSIDLDDQTFFKVNSDQSGIYITSYSDERWAKLGEQSDLLSVEDRVGLVADVKTLSASGYTSTINFMNLVSKWNKEKSFVVWEQIINSISSLKSTWLFEPKETQNALDNFTKQLISDMTHQLGWEFKSSDSFSTQRLKVTMFGAACAARDTYVEKAALRMFTDYCNGNKDAIPALIKPIVFNTAARIGGRENYEKVYEIYLDPISNDEKLAALRSLGRFKEPELLERTLGYLFDGTILNQDIYIPMQGMRAHQEGVKALWSWIQKNWEELVKRLPPGLSMLGSVVTLGTSGFTSLQKIDEIKKFFVTKSTKGLSLIHI